MSYCKFFCILWLLSVVNGKFVVSKTEDDKLLIEGHPLKKIGQVRQPSRLEFGNMEYILLKTDNKLDDVMRVDLTGEPAVYSHQIRYKGTNDIQKHLNSLGDDITTWIEKYSKDKCQIVFANTLKGNGYMDYVKRHSAVGCGKMTAKDRETFGPPAAHHQYHNVIYKDEKDVEYHKNYYQGN